MLGSFWDYVGMILKSRWDDFKIILGSFCNNCGMSVGSFRDHYFGICSLGEPSSDHRGNQARVAGNRRPRETQYDSLSEL